jgi:RNA polymerase sigma-70 factor, ECF subfamily
MQPPVPSTPVTPADEPQRQEQAPDDRAFFRALFEAEMGYVFHSLRRLGVAERDCADVAHEVFMIALRHLPTCDRSRPMRPWLFGIAYRVAADHRRLARFRREASTAPPDVPDSAPSPEEALDAQKRRALVARALDALEPGRRAVFIMHEIDGHAMPDIAEALEIPLNTGYSRLRLARAEFSAHVERSALATGKGRP